jgi:hypothetical protein
MADPADEWQPVAAAPQPQSDDGWQPVTSPTIDSRDKPQQAEVQRSYVGRVWDAFMNEGAAAFGDAPLGMSDKDIQWFQSHGMFREGVNQADPNPFRAFADGIVFNAIRAGDWGKRQLAGFSRGLGAAAYEAGAPKDVAGIIAGEEPMLPFAAPHIPVERAPMLAEGRDLGVIGPERPPVDVAKPAEAAAASVPRPPEAAPPARAIAAEAPSDVVRSEQPNGWRARFDEFVGKINTGEDAKDLIRNAADQNDDFPAARAGDIPLRQVEDLANAAGVPAETVDRTGAGRLLQNDNQVRNAMQAMLAATEEVKAAAREVRTDGSPENLQKLQEAMLRRDMWVEQVVGHRAEWGRTGNVFQEFLARTKEENGFTEWMKDQDRSPNGLKKLAEQLDGLEPGQVPKFLSDANKPGFADKAMWYWVNALISGPTTHAKYIGANALFAGYEAGVVTPLAGALGTLRRAVEGNREGVFAGEAGPRLWGLVAGVPDAMRAARSAFKTGLQTPLPGEVAQNILPAQNRAFSSNIQPIPGWLGKVIGIPSRGASGIHSFFNFLGYRASIEAQAYRQAAKEGLSPTDEAFWQRRQAAAANPTPEMMTLANEEGYRLTYISELGPAMKAVSTAVRKVPGGRLIMPFLHIPFNILARAAEGSPLAFLPEESRNNLLGRNGAVKQDMAVARLIAGSAIGAWAMNMVMNDRMTGFGPTDEKERAQWLATGHQPYSVRIGDYWLSFNRLGSIGTMLGLHTNLAEAIPHIKPDSDELTKAVAMTVHSTGRLLEDEVGMQGLANLMGAIDEPDRKGSRYVASFAGSWLPYSSALRQTASAMDPYMRETKGVVDGLRYYIPGQRQGLEFKRDWLGRPIPNAGYGGDLPVPGVSAIIQHRTAIPDALGMEMQALDLHPAKPEDRIAGVKLTPRLYDHYQAAAGALTESTLTNLINMPDWHSMPPIVRQQAFQKAISASRKAAGAAIQMQYPALIQAGIDQRMDQINGVTLSRPKKAPTSLEALQ